MCKKAGDAARAFRVTVPSSKIDEPAKPMETLAFSVENNIQQWCLNLGKSGAPLTR
jgi:hypothetical protein